MKIQLNTDDHIHGTEALAAQVTATIEQAMARFSEQITRIEVHFSDENGSKSGQHDHRCMLETRLKGQSPIAVTEHSKTLDQALNGAVRKLTHLLDSAIGRRQGHRDRTSALPLSEIEAMPDTASIEPTSTMVANAKISRSSADSSDSAESADRANSANSANQLSHHD